MHDEAHRYLRRALRKIDPPRTVVEIGARVASVLTVRELFADVESYIGIDPTAGTGVDVVTDGASWLPDDPVDLVVCCEVFEHTPRWRDIIANAYEMLVDGGAAIFTCAGPGRPEHGIDFDDHDVSGWYENIAPAEMWAAMRAAGFVQVEAEGGQSYTGTDTYAIGWRR